jgi:hypothetical protein
LPTTMKRNEVGSSYARSRRTDEGKMGRDWETEEPWPRTPANGGHGGQWRRNRPIEPHLDSNRGVGLRLEQRKRWRSGWRGESEGGAAIE